MNPPILIMLVFIRFVSMKLVLFVVHAQKDTDLTRITRHALKKVNPLAVQQWTQSHLTHKVRTKQYYYNYKVIFIYIHIRWRM